MKDERGFSLIELLLVVVIIGIVAALSVPALQKAVRAAENGNVNATMRAMASTQMNYYSTNQRYATLGELNSAMQNSLGTTGSGGFTMTRGKFNFSMTPPSPTPGDLRNEYSITATRNVASEGVIYTYAITQQGEVRQVLP